MTSFGTFVCRMENRAKFYKYLSVDGEFNSRIEFDINGPHYKFTGEYVDLLKPGEFIVNGRNRAEKSETWFGLFKTYNMKDMETLFKAKSSIGSEFFFGKHVLKQYKNWSWFPSGLNEENIYDVDWRQDSPKLQSYNSGVNNRKVSFIYDKQVWSGQFGFTQILRSGSTVYEPAYVFISDKKHLYVVNLHAHKMQYYQCILPQIMLNRIKVRAFVNMIRYRVVMKRDSMRIIELGLQAYNLQAKDVIINQNRREFLARVKKNSNKRVAEEKLKQEPEKKQKF